MPTAIIVPRTAGDAPASATAVASATGVCVPDPGCATALLSCCEDVAAGGGC